MLHLIGESADNSHKDYPLMKARLQADIESIYSEAKKNSPKLASSNALCHLIPNTNQYLEITDRLASGIVTC